MLERAEKGPFGPFSAVQGPAKAGWAMKGFPKGSQRVPEGFPKDWEGIPAGVDGICRPLGSFWGHFGGFPAIWAGHLGHLSHVRVSRNRLDLVHPLSGTLHLLRTPSPQNGPPDAVFAPSG